MKSRLKKMVSKPFLSLLKSSHRQKDASDALDSESKRDDIALEIPPLDDIHSEFNFDLCQLVRYSTISIDAIASSVPTFPRPDSAFSTSTRIPTIVVTGASPPSSLEGNYSQLSNSPFEGPSSQASPFYSHSASSPSNSQLSLGIMSKDLETILRRVNQEFDNFREEIRMLRQSKEKADRSYRSEVQALKMRVEFLEAETEELRANQRHHRALQHRISDDSIQLFDAMSTWAVSSPRRSFAFDANVNSAWPYDVPRCSLSAEKLLDSAAQATSEYPSGNIAPTHPYDSFADGSSADIASITSPSLNSSNSIPFPSVSPPSSPTFASFLQLEATYDNDDRQSQYSDDSQELTTQRLSIVHLVRKSYQAETESKYRRTLSTPMILPSQIGTASLDSEDHTAFSSPNLSRLDEDDDENDRSSIVSSLPSTAIEPQQRPSVLTSGIYDQSAYIMPEIMPTSMRDSIYELSNADMSMSHPLYNSVSFSPIYDIKRTMSTSSRVHSPQTPSSSIDMSFQSTTTDSASPSGSIRQVKTSITATSIYAVRMSRPKSTPVLQSAKLHARRKVNTGMDDEILAHPSAGKSSIFMAPSPTSMSSPYNRPLSVTSSVYTTRPRLGSVNSIVAVGGKGKGRQKYTFGDSKFANCPNSASETIECITSKTMMTGESPISSTVGNYRSRRRVTPPSPSFTRAMDKENLLI